jgi:hypothetical protein
MHFTSLEWPTMFKFGGAAILALIVIARLLLRG